MIFNHELCYLHFPKTGGIALSRELVQQLRGQVYYTIPSGHEISRGKEIILEGTRHENYNEAKELLAINNFNIRMEDFKCILVVIRNPYTYIISRYNYLNLNKPWDFGKAAVLARKANFKEFVLNMPFNYSLEKYILDESYCIPNNLVLVKFENLREEINLKLSPYLKSPIKLDKKINASKEGEITAYITSTEIEEIVYEKFKFAFEVGGYERLTLDSI